MDIDKLLNDRDLFNSFVYTPLSEVVRELRVRQSNRTLVRNIHELLKDDIPSELLDGEYAILPRHVATPNYELHRFLRIISELTGLHPVTFEYHSDKFVTNNLTKFHLGHLCFRRGINVELDGAREIIEIIDVEKANGLPINSIMTNWNQPLVEFHHQFLKESLPEFPVTFCNASDWFVRKGTTADQYYLPFLLLAVANGVLFENFPFKSFESEFSKEIFLPNFLRVINLLGVKPLIVSLEPTDIEDAEFWLSYPFNCMDMVHRLSSDAKM